MIDYGALLYGPVFDVLGVEATLTLDVTDAEPVTLTVLDKTAGVEVGDKFTVSTILPAAMVRVSELTTNGLAIASLRGVTITFNGKSWTIMRHEYRPSPKGEGDGELLLILEAA